MQVNFTHKNGKVQRMQKRFADILQKLGRGTYETRMLTAAPLDDLESLDVDALHFLAKQMDLKVHHKAGADKVRAAIEEARKAQQ